MSRSVFQHVCVIALAVVIGCSAPQPVKRLATYQSAQIEQDDELNAWLEQRDIVPNEETMLSF